MALVKQILFCGKTAIVCCDAKCNKAWGINNRPKVQLSKDEDDYAFLADGELGEAPVDPGTYEGDHAKPQTDAERMNKWCVRECERCRMSEMDHPTETLETYDFSQRRYNIAPHVRGKDSKKKGHK
jgi:hypothetical protein